MIIDWLSGDSPGYYSGSGWIYVWGFNVGAVGAVDKKVFVQLVYEKRR